MTTSVTSARGPTTSGSSVRPSRLLAAAVLLAFASVVVLLWVGDGRPVASVGGLPDPGAGTSWGLPLARVLSQLSAVLTVGLLLLGGVLVPARHGELRGARLRWTRVARWSALLWAGATTAQAVLTLSDVLAQPVPSVLDLSLLWSFLVDIDLGRSLAVQALLALVVGCCAYAVRTTTGAALTGLLAVVAVIPPTLTGHAGTSADHTLAVSSLMVHVVALTLWCGGITALVLLGTTDRRPFPVAVPRFSVLALWCAVTVAVSGAVSAGLRLSSPADLATTWYGRIVILKVLLLGVIAAFGVWHRKHSVATMGSEASRLQFVRIASVEVLVMAATIGVAVALSRTPPPVVDAPPSSSLTPARLLLGFDLPPAPDLAGLVWGEARPDGFWLTVVVLLGALYAVGLRALRRSGDAWPIGRAVSWYVGLLLLFVTTNSGVATYAHVMFSVHMVQHMLLSMVIPIFFVLAAPITLALRTLPRNAGELGPREWLTQVVHSRVVGVVSHPVVASTIFVIGFYGLYFTALFPWLMASHWGHIAMGVHFLLAGSLFFWSLIGIDPGPHRPPFLGRMVIMLVVMPLHSFFSIALMMTTTVIALGYYPALQRPYAVDLLADQHLGAGIGWATGEIPMVLVMCAMFGQWVRADEREARRLDRSADRAAAGGQGRDELADYNAYLRSLADGDRRRD